MSPELDVTLATILCTMARLALHNANDVGLQKSVTNIVLSKLHVRLVYLHYSGSQTWGN